MSFYICFTLCICLPCARMRKASMKIMREHNIPCHNNWFYKWYDGLYGLYVTSTNQQESVKKRNHGERQIFRWIYFLFPPTHLRQWLIKAKWWLSSFALYNTTWHFLTIPHFNAFILPLSTHRNQYCNHKDVILFGYSYSVSIFKIPHTPGKRAHFLWASPLCGRRGMQCFQSCSPQWCCVWNLNVSCVWIRGSITPPLVELSCPKY